MSGCQQCSARAVGEALPRPANVLASYGRSLVLIVSGSLMVLVFVSQTIIAMFQRSPRSYGFWSWVAAGETASWRLKWVAFPVLFAVLWFGRKLYRSIRLQPVRFCGVKYAQRGLLASAAVALLIAVLLGITVPARLRQHQMSIDAGIRARAYTNDWALLEYQRLYKTLPDKDSVREELARLPDPYGLIKDALQDMDPAGYQPRADVAAMAVEKSPRLRGSALMKKVSFNAATDDTPPGTLSFTNYELRLPGEDKILGTDDDWISRDGVIMKLADVASGGVGRTVSAGIPKP